MCSVRINFLALALLTSACASQPEYVAVPESNGNALLLVRLDDGKIVKQTISSEADICFKQNQSPETLCFSQGEPIRDPATDKIIGYRMTKSAVNLRPK